MNKEYDDYPHEVKIDIGGGITIKRDIECNIRGDSFFCSMCCFLDSDTAPLAPGYEPVEPYCSLFQKFLKSGEHDGIICCDACHALIKPQIQLAIAQEEYNESLHQD